MKNWLVICLMLLLALPASAVQKLNFKGFIADEAGILTEDVKNDLNMTLWDLQKKSGADIAVVTLPSLNGQSVENAALEIGRTYKVGSKEKNNGIVFLTALDEHKMRIELGAGLENKINISSLENIRDRDILPYYRKSDYKNGIMRGTYQLAELTAQAEGVSIIRQGTCPAQTYNHSRSSSRDRTPWWVYVIALIMAPFMPRRRSFDTGGFGGFGGGGSFGGCGCSGSW